MHIDFQILADGEDATEAFADRLVSITIIDEAGVKSDKATIQIDDRDYKVEIPEAGALLEISLGYKGSPLTTLGQYVVDEASGEGPVAAMTIEAKAADMLGDFKAQKTRSWDKKTLAQIVGKIAGEHGLKPQVAPSLQKAFYKYIAQTAESDLHFLTRIAGELDATAKPAGGSLVVVKRGEGKAADGRDLDVITIDASDMSGWTWNQTERGKYKCVTAEWMDEDTATVHKVKKGSGKPHQKLRHRYATKEEATRAAQGALDRSKRGGWTLNGSLATFWGDLSAEGKINLTGIKPELVGEWHITRVEHRLENTLTTSFDAEREAK